MITIIQYQTHLILNSKYSFIIKLMIIFSIYTLLTIDNITDVAFCAKKRGTAITEIAETKNPSIIRPVGDIFELERMRVQEKIIAYTNIEPEQLIEGFQKWRVDDVGSKHQPLPMREKMYLRNVVRGVDDPNYFNKVHYLFRMYQRLSGYR